MSEKISLVIACADNKRTHPLVDGSVGVENCTVAFRKLVSGEMYARSFEDPEFNVAELSLSNYVTMRQNGVCPYVAMPIYIGRGFVHTHFYVRTDRGIRSPADLRGRRVGLAEYNHTAHTWARQLLQDEYGVHPSDVQWISGRRETTNHPIKTDFRPPTGVKLDYIGPEKALADMLAAGEIDAMINPHAPSCVANSAPNVGRLITDNVPVEDAYFRKTGIFPIWHILGLRTELAQRNPWLPAQLFKAFMKAKNIGLDVSPDRDRLRALMGEDFFPYGLGERERMTLETFLGAHFDQGLSNRRFSVDELFTPFSPSEYVA